MAVISSFFRQISSSSSRSERLDPSPYLRIMQLIDHKVCVKSVVFNPFFLFSVKKFKHQKTIQLDNRPIYSSVLSDLALYWKRGWG